MELPADLIILERTALIIVDVQNDYCHPEGACVAYSRAAHEMTLENRDGYFGVVSSAAEVEEHWNQWGSSALPQML